jgi:hypothetical protein
MNLASVDQKKNINIVVELYKKYIEKRVTTIREAAIIKIFFLLLS